MPEVRPQAAGLLVLWQFKQPCSQLSALFDKGLRLSPCQAQVYPANVITEVWKLPPGMGPGQPLLLLLRQGHPRFKGYDTLLPIGPAHSTGTQRTARRPPPTPSPDQSIINATRARHACTMFVPCSFTTFSPRLLEKRRHAFIHRPDPTPLG